MYTNELCTQINYVHKWNMYIHELCTQWLMYTNELCTVYKWLKYKRGGNTTSNTIDYGILLRNNLTSLIYSDLDKNRVFFARSAKKKKNFFLKKNKYFFKKHT